MIPTIEDIVVGLTSGSMTMDKARHWLYEHIRLAEDRADTSDLRDHFAGKAMQAFISNTAERTGGIGFVDIVGLSAGAYKMADAMLEARQA